MPQDGRRLGASAAVPHLWARRLLRRVEEQARHQAPSRDEASDHHIARTGRELELVLYRRARHGAEMSAEPYNSRTLGARRAQMFPVLADEEIARLRRFGAPRRYADGECLFETGKTSPGMFVVLSGTLRITGRDGHGHDLLIAERSAPRPEDMPLVACPDGSVLRNPAENELARCIGMLDAAEAERVHDVAVVGAGPAGLATAVYAASEGLSVLVIDARAFGGQAGASARIENYLGFPTGISGQALAGRAYTQAQKFGARMLIPAEAVRLDCGRPEERDPLALELAGARSVRSRTVVIATGARYRRPDCSDLQALEGRGVWYWASPVEAKACAGQEVALVGGGNSAGQAAVFLARHAAKVWMLVRGAGLAASMSRYLVDRIAAIPNIELRTRTEIVALEGSRESGVESLRWRHRDSGAKETRAIRNVFLFLGADPATEWLKGCAVAFDDKGFVRTGAGGRLPLETSVPGVFAIGDVRSGSVKRVGGAIGEGAAVVAQIHAFLAREDTGVEARAA